MATKDETQRQRQRRGYWLRLARRRSGYTLQAVAELLGYSKASSSTIKLWEDGARDPSVSQLEALANLYGIDPGFFMRPPMTDEERLEEIASGTRREPIDDPAVQALDEASERWAEGREPGRTPGGSQRPGHRASTG